MDGSGHLEIGFGGDTDVSVHSTEDELRLVIESTGDHEASMSAVLDPDTARDLGDELVYRANRLDSRSGLTSDDEATTKDAHVKSNTVKPWQYSLSRVLRRWFGGD